MLLLPLLLKPTEISVGIPVLTKQGFQLLLVCLHFHVQVNMRSRWFHTESPCQTKQLAKCVYYFHILIPPLSNYGSLSCHYDMTQTFLK